jgi:hypothetical protein
MFSITIAVAIVSGIAITAIAVVALVLLHKTGSLRDLRYVAEVVRAFHRPRKQ